MGANPSSKTIRLVGPAQREFAKKLIDEVPDGWLVDVRKPKKRDRSTEQNRLQFKWATEVAAQCQDRSIEEIRHDWKLRHGVPILRRDNAGFRAFYDAGLRPLPTFEQKIAAMRYVPITSLMDVPQMQEYLDLVQRESLQQGYVLTDPDALKYSE